MIKNLKTLLSLVMLMFAIGVNAQVTTSSISGIVVDEKGFPLTGATVEAKHTPSGTFYGAVANLDGRYTIQGMRTGGPYTVKVSFIGYKSVVYNDIYLQLGNVTTVDAALELSANSLDEVVVVGQAAAQAGASRNFSLAKIQGTPTVDRNLYDIVKNMPVAETFKDGGISFAGINNRYNSFQIDGAVSNDVFGLAASGTNGGQANANPISLDAIQEIQVVVAPFDVRQGGFTGGGINAITKQGNNEYHASFYTYYHNQNFYGRHDAANDYKYSKLTKQNLTTIGGSISGPIVKDKLFYFLNIENTKESTPAGYYPGYNDRSLSPETAQQIVDRYEQITGIRESYGKRDISRKDFSLLARVDWNINKNHKLALRYQHINAYNEAYKSSSSVYYFNNSSYRYNNNTNSFVAELNSQMGDWFNELRLSYNRVRDDRVVPYEGPLVYLTGIPAQDPANTLNVWIGSEASSTANHVHQDVYTVEDNLTWYKGRHTFTVGTHNEFFKLNNLFIQYVTGAWAYSSVENFINDKSNTYFFNCTDPSVTDGNLRYAPTAKAGQFGLYVQDKFDVNRNLQLTYGLRADVPVLFNEPTVNHAFNAFATLNRLGVRQGEMPGAKVMLSPRIGFRWYTDNSHKTLIRGGVGLFTGRVPFVWLVNAYNNNGIEQTGMSVYNAADIPAITTNTSSLADYLGEQPSPNIVTISKKFRYPQVLRVNLAWEQKLPYDINFTLEGLYSKTFNNIYFRNVALKETAKIYAVPGVDASIAPYFSSDGSYASIINTENTNKGYSYNISAILEKRFNFGLDVMASYTYGRSKSVNDGTSSVALSNWQKCYSVNTNAPELSFSSFDHPHKVVVSLGYTTPKYANGWLQSSLSVIYNGTTGMRYSLTMSESKDFNGDGRKGNSLMYIPTDAEIDVMNFVDMTAKDGSVIKSVEQQRTEFKQFCGTDDYAKNHRGQYAVRNSNIAPWENRIDLHFAQDIFLLKNRGSKIQFTFDVMNFANMLNKEWGVHYATAYVVTPLTVTGVAKGADGNYAPTYQVNTNTKPAKDNLASRWHAQVGVKLTF